MDHSLDQVPFSLNIPDYKEPAAEERRTEEAAVEQGSNLVEGIEAGEGSEAG